MKKEIGSIFPLNYDTIAEQGTLDFPVDRIYYSLCREAFSDVATALSKSSKTVLIPAFTCQTVIIPFEEVGWKCTFYPIKKNLRIDTKALLDLADRIHPAVTVVHPYFGMELNGEETSALEQINRQGIKVVLDQTQCIFSSQRYPFVSFTIGSYRKWFPIPDGGFMECHDQSVSISQPATENTEFTERMKDAMYLRDLYFINGEQRTKDISIWLTKYANRIGRGTIIPHKMSCFAYGLLQNEDKKRNQQSRIDNYSYLFHNIRDSKKVLKACQNLQEVTTAPLYFTIYVEDRKYLQSLLAQEGIYAPVIWPVEDEKVLINDEVTYIYEHLLAIPCDQRYDKSDMSRIIEIINSNYN